MVSDLEKVTIQIADSVLILVVMEYGLRLGVFITFFIWFVLILVVMEYGLRLS